MASPLLELVSLMGFELLATIDIRTWLEYLSEEQAQGHAEISRKLTLRLSRQSQRVCIFLWLVLFHSGVDTDDPTGQGKF